jgi:hypothetical protein
MPYEEYYNPTDDILDDVKGQKTVEDIKKLDKQYQKYSKLLNDTWVDGRFYKKVKIECYGSGPNGSRIRNAVTGQYYPYLVGSVNEDLLFKVVDASGRNCRQEPLILFYDSPEQYENHKFVTLNQQLKEQWYQKSLSSRKTE